MMCYRVLGRGEDFIMGMLRAVKADFGGARSVTCRRVAGMWVNGLERKIEAGRAQGRSDREGQAGATGPFCRRAAGALGCLSKCAELVGGGPPRVTQTTGPSVPMLRSEGKV